MLWLAQKMNEETDGKIITREPRYSLSQSLTGNKKTTDYIKVTYQYKMDTLLITGSYNLDYSLINSAQLNRISSAPLPVAVKVKYNKNYPYKSMIWIP